jgi:precorrin-2 dehydrogenase/sirohydrochlorin ferrochelatase
VAFGFPIMLDVTGRRAVVIGPEPAVGAKAAQLRDAGADVVRRASGAWVPEDLDAALVCVAWSPSLAERDRIAREARARGVLVNVMDDVANCDFAAPALVRRGELVIAIATGGRSPTLARKIRELVEAAFGPEWEEAFEVLADLREATLTTIPDMRERANRWYDALDLNEVADLARDGRLDVLRERLSSRLGVREVVA